MCGITGYFGRGDETVLREMTGSLSYRGPDDEGFFVSDGIGLGHRRLSIIDLAGGHQPLANEDGNIRLVFNGEIYNFQDLRKHLGGHRFSTRTDCEVIVHLYEEYQEGFLDYLNGMFAGALWDGKKLILFRDRLGQKPLYYSFVNQTLVFGSEIKALLKHPSTGGKLDRASLAKYLAYEYVPAPDSIFEGVKKLRPGEYLVCCGGKIEVKKYWEVKFEESNLSKEDYLWDLDKRLEKSVKDRLISDVPLGVFLSGGIDSTAIAHYAQKNSSQKIKTFSVGFADSSFDESRYIHQAVKHLGTEHHEQILSSRDCLDLIPQIAEFLDEPLADASIIPTYLLSKFTRQKVKVALSGDGADELLMGYPTFQVHKLAQFYRLLPFKGLIKSAVDCLPVSFNNISLDFALKRFVSGFEYPPEIQNQIWLGSFNEGQIGRLLGHSVDVYGNIGSDFNCLEHRLIYQYLKNYLQDDILVKTDRASMANGLEARAPFLDHGLVDFINSVPVKFKLKGFCSKYLFKELMKDKLPREIVYRKKKGFGIPVARWIRGDLREFTLDMLSEEKIKREGVNAQPFMRPALLEVNTVWLKTYWNQVKASMGTP